MPMLAQIMIAPGLSEPPAFPPPPLVDRLIFESPYPLAAGFMIVALVVFLAARERLNTKHLLLAMALPALLAFGVVLTGTLVVTDREAIAVKARELVDAVASANPEQTNLLLAEDASLYAFFTSAKGIAKPDILSMVQSEMSTRYRLHDHRVREVRVNMEGPRVARSHVLVMVDPEQTRMQTWSWWRLDWVREDGKWLVRGIEPLSIQGLENAGPR